MRNALLLEERAFERVAVPRIESLGADARVENDHAIAFPPRPGFGETQELRADALALPALRHRHLLELERVRTERLEGDRADHLAVDERAEMFADRVVIKLIPAK